MAPIATTRPLTDEERAFLTRTPVKLLGWRTGTVSASLIFALTFVVAALFAIRFPYEIVVRSATAAAALASVALYLWIQHKERKKLSDGSAAVASEAAAGFGRLTILSDH